MPETVQTFADVIAFLYQDSSVPESRRRDELSALRSMARLLGKEPADIPANTAWLRQRLKQFHPRQAGISNKRFANIKSAVVSALRRAGAGRRLEQAKGEMSGSWLALYQKVPDRNDGYKLSRFLRWLSAQDIGSADVTQDHLDHFAKMLADETLVKDPHKNIRSLVGAWNRQGEIIADWPRITLQHDSRRSSWTIPLEQFPAAFQADVDAWKQKLAVDDLFDEDAPTKPLRPATIKHRSFQIRMMASAIVLSGRDIDTIQSLADLVAVEAFKAGLTYMRERQAGHTSEALFGLATGIKAIARHHVKVDAEHFDQLKRICARLDQTADRTRKRTKERLDQFDDPLALQKLLALPQRLNQPVTEPNAKPRTHLLRLQSALAIEILLHCPMRIGNLAGLNRDRHLRWAGQDSSLIARISIPANEVKNNVPLNYELVGDQARMLHGYLRDIQPQLCTIRTSAVFPKLDGTPRNPADLSQQLKRTIFKETGLVVHAHLFRQLVARIHSMVNAGDFGTVTQVLSDKTSTVMKSYANHEQKSSLRRYRASVLRVRTGSHQYGDN